MTYKEFLKALAKTRLKFKWRITREGCIRAGYGRRCHCPITAVCKLVTNESENCDLFINRAAEKIKIKGGVVNNIVTAADHRISMLNKMGTRTEEKKIRKDILRVLHLKEKKAA